MRGEEKPIELGSKVNQSTEILTPVPGLMSHHDDAILAEGPLRMPLTGQLRHQVLAQIRRGQHRIVLDLARVSTIDAAGVSQLVRAYNSAVAADGGLQVVHTTAWVREMLERAGLLALLSGQRKAA